MIYVFKTSVKTKKDIRQLSKFLNEIVQQKKWSFDLENCDKILQIDSQTDLVESIINGLNNRGFICEELE